MFTSYNKLLTSLLKLNTESGMVLPKGSKWNTLSTHPDLGDKIAHTVQAQDFPQQIAACRNKVYFKRSDKQTPAAKNVLPMHSSTI